MPQTAATRTTGPEHSTSESEELHEIVEGLLAAPRRIDSRYFYDQYGSQLFEEITRLPEYYPTRTEIGLLETNSADITAALGRGQLLLEPGAGNCGKVRLLLPDLRPVCYVPVDISGPFLRAAAAELQAEFPTVRVLPLVGDMAAVVDLPPEYDTLRRNVFYPGSTIGNYQPAAAEDFLRHMRGVTGSSGNLLVGVDLQKDVDVLHAAYNDSAGVTARFNLNILTHINRLADADFDVERFRHIAFYNEAEGRIEIASEEAGPVAGDAR